MDLSSHRKPNVRQETLGFFHLQPTNTGTSTMNTKYKSSPRSYKPSVVSRGVERGGRPVGSVTLNCDFKKSIWPERLDVLFQLNFLR